MGLWGWSPPDVPSLAKARNAKELLRATKWKAYSTATKHVAIRNEALRALADPYYADNPTTAAVVSVMSTDASADVRATASDTFRIIGDSGSASLLFSDTIERMVAQNLLEEIRERAATKRATWYKSHPRDLMIQALVAHPDPECRAEVAMACSYYGDVTLSQYLLSAKERDSSLIVRKVASWALVRLGHAIETKGLLKSLTESYRKK